MSIFGFFKSLRLARPGNKDDGTVRYVVDNSGALTIDVEALVNSPGFNRQLEACRRLQAIQNPGRVFLIVSAYSKRTSEDEA